MSTFREEFTAALIGYLGDWEHLPDAQVIPTTDTLTFDKTGKRIDVCILYADIHGSTSLVDSTDDWRAASYYKAFLHAGGKLAKKFNGEITSYDGDRIMVVFHGDDEVGRACLMAFSLNCLMRIVINPAFAAVYGAQHRDLLHTVGIDFGKILVAKTGIRGRGDNDSDRVWIGAAANYAAKLNSFDGLDISFPTRITSQALQRIGVDRFFFRNGAPNFWNGPYNNYPNRTHYRSNGWMDPDTL